MGTAAEEENNYLTTQRRAPPMFGLSRLRQRPGRLTAAGTPNGLGAVASPAIVME